MVVKMLYGPEVVTVQIGPCIDAKDEAFIYESGNLVDGVLTFVELRELFDESRFRRDWLKCQILIASRKLGELFILCLRGSSGWRDKA